MSETRRQRRFRRRCEIEFVTNNALHRGICSDFSLQGLFIRTSSPLPPDTVLNLVLYLSDGLTARLKVKVKRSEKAPEAPARASQHGMGVEIIEKDTTYLRFITSLLA